VSVSFWTATGSEPVLLARAESDREFPGFAAQVRNTTGPVDQRRRARLITGATLSAGASQADAPAGVTGCHLEGSAGWPG
jgi:hypothetical protein